MAAKKKEKKPEYVVDGKRGEEYVRAWSQANGRNREICVQVWLSGEMAGEPQGDWAMPGVLGYEAAIAQAVLQTKADPE